MADFLDADVIVFAFTDNPKKAVCRKFISENYLIVDVLVLVEAFSKISTITKNSLFARKVIMGFFKSGIVKIMDIDVNVLFNAMKRKEKCSLKISDLIHYVTALDNSCSAIISYDRDFDSLLIPRHEP